MQIMVYPLLLIATALVLLAQQGTRLAEEEMLVGITDGVNTTFNLNHVPFPWISLRVFRNGLRMTRCRNGVTTACDYTLVTPYNKLVFVAAQIPQPGDILVADYRW